MKNRIFSLVLGMIVILTTMAATSCARGMAQNDTSTSSVAIMAAEDISTSPVYTDQGLADIDDTSTGSVTEATDLLSWQGILSFVLLIVSTVFGVYWKKASNVLNMLHDGLQEGSPGGKTLTAAEIKRIVAAWKGN